MAASHGNGADLGEVAFKFTADAWGYGADETTSPYRFTARRMDEETGNYYYRYIYYHPDSGRFMSNDPIGYGDGLNMYAYAYNDPVNYTDPMGLTPQAWLGRDEGGASPPVITVTGVDLRDALAARFASDLTAALRGIVLSANLDEVRAGLGGRIAADNKSSLEAAKEAAKNGCVTPESINAVLTEFVGYLGATQGGVSVIEDIAGASVPGSRQEARARKKFERSGRLSFGAKLGRSLGGVSLFISGYNVGEVAIRSGLDIRATSREVAVQGSVFYGGVLSSYIGGKFVAAGSKTKRGKVVGSSIGAFLGGLAYGFEGGAEAAEDIVRELFDEFYEQQYCSAQR